MQGELEKEGESVIIFGSILHLNAGIFQITDQTNTWKHLHVFLAHKILIAGAIKGLLVSNSPSKETPFQYLV